MKVLSSLAVILALADLTLARKPKKEMVYVVKTPFKNTELSSSIASNLDGLDAFHMSVIYGDLIYDLPTEKGVFVPSTRKHNHDKKKLESLVKDNELDFICQSSIKPDNMGNFLKTKLQKYQANGGVVDCNVYSMFMVEYFCPGATPSTSLSTIRKQMAELYQSLVDGQKEVENKPKFVQVEPSSAAEKAFEEAKEKKPVKSVSFSDSNTVIPIVAPVGYSQGAYSPMTDASDDEESVDEFGSGSDLRVIQEETPFDSKPLESEKATLSDLRSIDSDSEDDTDHRFGGAEPQHAPLSPIATENEVPTLENLQSIQSDEEEYFSAPGNADPKYFVECVRVYEPEYGLQEAREICKGDEEPVKPKPAEKPYWLKTFNACMNYLTGSGTSKAEAQDVCSQQAGNGEYKIGRNKL